MLNNTITAAQYNNMHRRVLHQIRCAAGNTLKLRWLQLHKEPSGQGLCEYRRGRACGEQWLLLRSVLPAEVAVPTASTAATLKIHSTLQ